MRCVRRAAMCVCRDTFHKRHERIVRKNTQLRQAQTNDCTTHNDVVAMICDNHHWHAALHQCTSVRSQYATKHLDELFKFSKLNHF